MSGATWLPLVSSLVPAGEGRYEVRGTSTRMLIGWVERRGETWHGEVAVFKADGTHETDQGQVVRRPLSSWPADTRQEAWARVESAALRDALRPAAGCSFCKGEVETEALGGGPALQIVPCPECGYDGGDE